MDKFLTPDYLLPFIAIFISIISLFFSVYTSRKTFRLTEGHNKKSVEPILSHLYIAQLISNTENYSIESLQIKNCGFGPAIIKSFIFIKDNKTYNNMFNLYSQIIGEPRYKTDLSTVHTISNSTIGTNETVTIFKFYFAKVTPLAIPFSDAVAFHKLAQEISLKIQFETIYGEKRIFIVDSITV